MGDGEDLGISAAIMRYAQMTYSTHGKQLSGSHGVGVVSSVGVATLDRLIAEQEAALIARMPRSRELLENAKESLAGGVASNWQAAKPLPIWIDRGKGSRIWDADGHEYVDMHGCFGAMMVGHAHPAIVRAVSERIAKGSH